jgi:catalase
MTAGIDSDHSKRDLFETIEKGGSYKWTMMVQVGNPTYPTCYQPPWAGLCQPSRPPCLCRQVMQPEDATKVSFDPFDVTKVWPRGEYTTRR